MDFYQRLCRFGPQMNFGNGFHRWAQQPSELLDLL